ncbi:hypothetical protein EAF00_012045 [Botryotinia globosa]|nr:hypothetical protein EAF00_012045 [Botryotinia globosa]
MYTEGKQNNEVNEEAADRFKESASGTGVATPYGILLNMCIELKKGRELQEEILRQNRSILESLSSISSLLVVGGRKSSEDMDVVKNTLDSIYRVSDRPAVSSSMIHAGASITSASSQPRQAKVKTYYYDGEKLKSGPGLISCVLQQLISICLENRIRTKYPSLTNYTPASYKELRNMIDIIVKADPSISLPKPSEPEFQSVAKVVASTDQGYAIKCSTAQISMLSSNCSRVMSCVEAVRKKLLKCQGLLGPMQHVCLQSIMYPYATADDIVVSDSNAFTDGKMRALRSGAARVKQLKDKGRKKYIEAMMNGSVAAHAYLDVVDEDAT